LFDEERAGLIEVGLPGMGEQPAGSYTKRLLNRLLIDLSWNSSRLKGNTDSLLDTTRLIEIGEEAQDKDRREAQMIPNHEDAIEILVENARHIGFNRHAILNLHGALAANLLPDSGAPGRLRQIAVTVDGSVFHLLEGGAAPHRRVLRRDPGQHCAFCGTTDGLFRTMAMDRSTLRFHILLRLDNVNAPLYTSCGRI